MSRRRILPIGRPATTLTSESDWGTPPRLQVAGVIHGKVLVGMGNECRALTPAEARDIARRLLRLAGVAAFTTETDARDGAS